MIDAARQAFLATCPPPLVPPDCDLRDFKYMPIFIERLRKSETWINARYDPEGGFAAINLWFSSWHELPAASLELNENTLAEAAMCQRSRWPTVRTAALRGWILCSDGRLYHPVVAAYALEAWATRTKYRQTMAIARGAKAAKADAKQPSLDLSGDRQTPGSAGRTGGPTHMPSPRDEGVPPPVEVVSANPPDVVPDGEEPQKTAIPSMIGLKVEGREKKVEKKKGSLRSPHARVRACGRVCEDPAFDKFIRDYPVPQSPRFARIEWDAALARGVDPEEILAGLAQHRFAENPRFIKHPAGWLAGECWRAPGVPAEQCTNGWAEVLRRSRENGPLTIEADMTGYMLPTLPAEYTGA